MCVGGGGGATAGGTVGSRAGSSEAQNYEKWGVSKKKVIKQGQMKNLRKKLLCIGILNLG